MKSSKYPLQKFDLLDRNIKNVGIEIFKYLLHI